MLALPLSPLQRERAVEDQSIIAEDYFMASRLAASILQEGKRW
jgi:hypothetical protein